MCKGLGNNTLAKILADAYAQDWVGTEDFSEATLDMAMREGFLENKYPYIRAEDKQQIKSFPELYPKGLQPIGNHYWLSQKGLDTLKTCTNFPFGASLVDTRKVRFKPLMPVGIE